MRNGDERHLVARCLAGQREAFDALYDRHAARVFHLLRRLSGNEAEAEDLTQETFLAAYQALGSWRGDAAFGSWLCGIAFRRYASAQRRRARDETEPLSEEIAFAPPDADPLVHCLRHEREQQLEAAIAALPPICREAFLLVKVEGFSYREAAACLEVPIGTLQSRLWRAVCALQKVLCEGITPPPAPSPKRRGGLPGLERSRSGNSSSGHDPLSASRGVLCPRFGAEGDSGESGGQGEG